MSRSRPSSRPPGPPTGSAPPGATSCAPTASRRRPARRSTARNAARPRPRRSAASARPRARHGGAAATAPSRSTCSNAIEGPGGVSVTFHSLEIAEIVPETAEASSIRFSVPEALREAFRFRPGQHLTLRAELGGEEVRRNYSLCVAPEEGELTVTVKRIAGGLFSNWANDALKPGDRLDVMEPHGSFTWDFRADAANHYVAFAGGSGITPVMSLIRTAMIEEPGSRFTLFYGNRDSQSVIFLEALARLKNRHMGRLEIHHFLAEESEDIELFNGMRDRGKCDAVLDSLVGPAGAAAFFVCGPGPMMDAAEAALLARGVPAEKIHVERFTADRPPEALQAQLEAMSE